MMRPRSEEPATDDEPAFLDPTDDTPPAEAQPADTTPTDDLEEVITKGKNKDGKAGYFLEDGRYTKVYG